MILWNKCFFFLFIFFYYYILDLKIAQRKFIIKPVTNLEESLKMMKKLIYIYVFEYYIPIKHLSKYKFHTFK